MCRSDEQFVIDVESVEVERRHFLEAVSAITPASHRGAVTHARPFSAVISPCLEGHLQTIMKKLSDIFPVMNRDASSSNQSDSEEDESPEQLARLFGLGGSGPLVYRPKFLLCGREGAGLVCIETACCDVLGVRTGMWVTRFVPVWESIQLRRIECRSIWQLRECCMLRVYLCIASRLCSQV